MDFITSKPTIDQAELKKILFNRPVSIFQKPSVGIVAGKYAKLPVLNELYDVLASFGLDPIIVADEQNKSLALPADIFLETSAKLGLYKNADEAIEALRVCKLVFFISGEEINAAFALFCEKLAKVFNHFAVVDDKKLITKEWAGISTIVYGSTKNLLRGSSATISKQTGLKLKAALQLFL